MGQDWTEDDMAVGTPSATLSMDSNRTHVARPGVVHSYMPPIARALSGTIAQQDGSTRLLSSRESSTGVPIWSSSNFGSGLRRSSNATAFGSATSLFHPGNELPPGSITVGNPTHHVDQPLQSTSKACGSLPLPTAHASRDDRCRQAPSKPALLPRPSRYRYSNPDLGSNDPRLDAIRLGLLSSNEARSLFTHYAKAIEPLGLGFPEFPASSELTPVLLSAITAVTSLLSPSPELRSRQPRLQNDILDRTLPYAPTTAEDEFNPESGIGTEEVVGACIWSTYQGSMEAWKVARAARWWSEKYSYETGPHAGLTVGEMVAILPPVRHVSMQDRVRVWLTAFTTELHQCEIHGKESIMQLVDPAQYGQALMADISETSMTKQDAALVFFSRVAYLVARSRESGDAETLLEVTRKITLSWCTTRALLATDPDKRDAYDHTIDLHYLLAKTSVLVRACRAREERLDANATSEDITLTTAAFVSTSQTCQNAAMDSIKLLLSPNARFVGSLAALPSIYHFWIAQSAVFLLELCMIDGMHYRLGMLVAGQMDEILATVRELLRQYLAELSACSTKIEVTEASDDGEVRHETIKHPALDAALAVAEVLAGVQATA